MQIDFTIQEVEELRDIIRERMGELSEEIHHADRSEFQDQLKARKAQLRGILEKLAPQS